MKVDISKTSGKSSGKKITLSDKIFGIEPNDHAIYLDVKSYLKNQVFESIKDKLQKKRKKIPSDDFEIPDVKDFNFLLTKGYNVKQLKDICKFYKQKKSGNKSELIFLLYNWNNSLNKKGAVIREYNRKHKENFA